MTEEQHIAGVLGNKLPEKTGTGAGFTDDDGIAEPANNKLESDNMEVHHHPELPHKGEKKNFKEYFLEFLMIFLAVTMGFFAESLREHISDGEKEKQYIESFAADLRADTAACEKSIRNIFLQVHKIDTLEEVLSSANLKGNDSNVTKCYNLSWAVQNEYTISFNERTINQLISSGNMRLLQRNVSDSVMDYFTLLKSIETQKQFYTSYTSKCIDMISDYFEFRYNRTFIAKDTSLGLVNSGDGKPALLTTDDIKLDKFNSTIEYTKRIAYSYMIDIIQVKKKAATMLTFLHQQYGI